MVLRIDRRKEKVSAGKAKGKAGAVAGKAAPAKGGEEARVDRFAGIGRVIGGSGPSDLISTRGPRERLTMPLTSWEKYDIDHDPMFREAAARMKAYRDLPDPWKRKVDEWGRKVSKEMKYALAKAIMKG
jgi:hypothetical protein